MHEVSGRLAGLVVLLAIAAGRLPAQDAAETAAMTAHSAAAAQSASRASLVTAMPPKQTSAPATTGSGKPPAYLLPRTGPPADEVNRKDFEDNAGENAGKLLLRSKPSGAEIFINGRLVGRTPLLMVIAPGKYQIGLRGPREESGQTTVGVMPKETYVVAITLNQKYPAGITTR
ncbi:MAG TPA: PEGA domain-containing protein [Candidatus Cybelea sp.]|nr:PEGA domain-containing protein [Candidatus Cybelea sp.]